MCVAFRISYTGLLYLPNLFVWPASIFLISERFSKTFLLIFSGSILMIVRSQNSYFTVTNVVGLTQPKPKKASLSTI